MIRWNRFLLVILAVSLALVLAACGGGDEKEAAAPEAAPVAQAPVSTGDPVKGEEMFNTTCIACHGQGGIGVQGLGKDMTKSTFIAGLDDKGLLDFIKQGRDPGNPANTTGIAMPPKGGNPALTDEQLLDIIAYIRTIHVN